MSTVIARHRTAIARTELSRPLRIAFDDMILREGMTVLDYGCGLGGDVTRLRERGYVCEGWDPNHRPEGQRRPSDVVNIGYVVNVVENPNERCHALRAAWALASKVLIVAARLRSDLGVAEEPGSAFGDGRLTRISTFQKFYEQQELRAWVDDTLDVVSVVAAPGIFYVFRSEEARTSFVAGRVRRVIAAPKLKVRERLLIENPAAFAALSFFLAHRGRLPDADELPEYEELTRVAGSLTRAYRVIEQSSEAGAWDDVRDARTQDLLIYLALVRFEGRPNFTSLPKPLQRDVKAFCGSYVGACARADELLFSLGAPGQRDAACRSAPVGKSMPTALYVHTSAVQDLPALLRLYEGCARSYIGAVEGPSFETDPHPTLVSSVSVHLQTFRMKQRSFAEAANPPVLHRKELFVSPTHKLWPKFERLTRIEEERGLFNDPAHIGLRDGWLEALRSRNLSLRGHRLVRATPSQPDEDLE
jgi:DNA phosphorothioation-associated putative methyltransferase